MQCEEDASFILLEVEEFLKTFQSQDPSWNANQPSDQHQGNVMMGDYYYQGPGENIGYWNDGQTYTQISECLTGSGKSTIQGMMQNDEDVNQATTMQNALHAEASRQSQQVSMNLNQLWNPNA